MGEEWAVFCHCWNWLSLSVPLCAIVTEEEGQKEGIL